MAPRPGRLAFVDLAYGSLGGSLNTSSGHRSSITARISSEM
jgi:hypothetical protein